MLSLVIFSTTLTSGTLVEHIKFTFITWNGILLNQQIHLLFHIPHKYYEASGCIFLAVLVNCLLTYMISAVEWINIITENAGSNVLPASQRMESTVASSTIAS
jgi:hypothetical protein